jgi:hypothetical protein
VEEGENERDRVVLRRLGVEGEREGNIFETSSFFADHPYAN